MKKIFVAGMLFLAATGVVMADTGPRVTGGPKGGDLSVPGPIAGVGLPFLLAAFGVAAWFRSRRDV